MNHKPPAATGGTIDIDFIFDEYLEAQKDDDSMEEYLFSMDKEANDCVHNIMNNIDSISGIGNVSGKPTKLKNDMTSSMVGAQWH